MHWQTFCLLLWEDVVQSLGNKTCFSTMATPHPKQPVGNICTFNIQHGFAEALVRGMRSSFMKDADYHHLTQCETLDDVKLNLSETDYADALADSDAMTPAAFQKVAVEKVGLE